VHLVDTMMTAGLCLIVGAAVFLVAAGLKAGRTSNRGSTGDSPRGRLDLFMFVFWCGMLLVQVSSILFHALPGGIYQLSPLTLAATGGVVFVCGVFTGRLLLRREMRLQKGKFAGLATG